MPDKIASKSGYNYTLTTEAIDADVSAVTADSITLKGTTDGDKATASFAFYDLSTQRVTITLNAQEEYNQYYRARIGGETYVLKTVETAEEKADSAGLRSVWISDDKKTAEIGVYNSTYEAKTLVVKGDNGDGEPLSTEIYLDGESVGSVTFTGTGLNAYTWSAELK